MTVDMRARQAPLRARFGQHPGDAMVTDRAETWSAIDDPLHGVVVAGGGAIPFAVHWEVGGRHDGPVPGDLLCAALAACADSTLRIVASHHRLPLDAVRCIATGDVDVRGTLGVSRGVDIGFQQMQLQIELTAPRASASERRRLLCAVENSCVVLQTLRNGVSVRLESPDLATDPS